MSSKDVKKLSDLARTAIRVQDACNLRGVLGAAHEASLILGRHPDCTGTQWVNEHPVMVLFSDKIRSLTLSDDDMKFSYAYAECLSLCAFGASQKQFSSAYAECSNLQDEE